MLAEMNKNLQISSVVLAGLMMAAAAMAEPQFDVSGEFEYDHVSVKDGDTTDDLTKAEITLGAVVSDDVSAEMTIAAIDEETDEDSTVDDDLELDAAVLSYEAGGYNLTLQAGMWAAPVGQFETLSVSDPLALGEVETTRNRGMVAIWSPVEAIELTVFAGTMDDSASSNVSGGNLALSWEFLTVNIGQISDTAGDISEGATTYALKAEHSGFAAMAELVSMDDTNNTEYSHFELNYAMEIEGTPVAFGIGQSTMSQDGVEDSEQQTYTIAVELTENIGVTLDQTVLEEPGEDDVEATTLKVGFAF